jgi:hypothetical protein
MENAKFVQNTAMATVLGSILGIIANLSYIGDPGLAHETTGFALMTRLLMGVGLVLILAGIFGLWRSGGIDRDSGSAKIGFGMSVLGQAIVIINQILTNDIVSIISAALLGIGMIILGLAVIQADVWQSWRKYVPIFYGIFPFSAIFLYPVAATLAPNAPDYVLAIMTISIFLIFGLALWIEGGQMKSNAANT